MKVLAIIPARGGSKGVPRKNIREVEGKPLIAYTIETALACTDLSKVIVSTDDLEIKEVSEKYGAEVHLRPEELANDTANVADAVEYVLNAQDEEYDIVFLLQPTSPLRLPQDITNTIKFFKEDKDLEGVISVVSVGDNHPARMYSLDDAQHMNSNDKSLEYTRRQDLPKLYIRNGSIYAVTTKVFREQKTLMPEHKKAYVMDSKWAVNIDEERDLDILEVVLPRWKELYNI